MRPHMDAARRRVHNVPASRVLVATNYQLPSNYIPRTLDIMQQIGYNT